MLTPDGTLAAGDVHGSGSITFRRVPSGKPVGAAVKITESLGGMAFSRDSRVMAVSDNGGSRMWVLDRHTGRKIATATVRNTGDTSITGLAVSPDGSRAVAVHSSLAGSEVRVGDLKAGSWRGVARIDEPEVRATAFSPDGRTLAVLGLRSGHLVDVTSGKVRSFARSGQTLTAVAFHPTKPIVVTGDYAGRLTVWDTATGARRGPVLHSDVHEVKAMAFSPDGALLATASGHGVQLWDVTAGRTIGDPISTYATDVVSVAIGGDGSFVAGQDEQGTVRLQPLAPDAMVRAVCARVGRTLTERERQEYLPGVAYMDVCAGGS
jgi:WD40 repeat protein